MFNSDKFRAELERRIAERVSSMPDEQAANQAGRLTAGQQQRLADGISSSFTVPMILVAVMLIMPCIGVVFLVANPSQKPTLLYFLVVGGLAALLFLILGAMLLRRAWLLQEVKAGQLQRAAGKVILHGDTYRVQVPGHKLDLTKFNAFGAGEYVFSFLPRSRQVVDVERTSPAPGRDELLNALAATNHFKVDDLPAYRDGNFGRSTPWLGMLWAWFGTAFLLLLALLFLVWSVPIIIKSVGASNSGDRVEQIIALTGAVLVFGVLGLIRALAAVRITLDVLGGKVASAEGGLEKDSYLVSSRYRYGSTRKYYYYMKGRDERWYVPEAAYAALIGGQTYRLYYLPFSKRLVGIEPIA